MKTWLLGIGLVLLMGGLFSLVRVDSKQSESESAQAIRMAATGEHPEKIRPFLGWGAVIIGVAAMTYGLRSSGPLLPSVKPLDQQSSGGDWQE